MVADVVSSIVTVVGIVAALMLLLVVVGFVLFIIPSRLLLNILSYLDKYLYPDSAII